MLHPVTPERQLKHCAKCDTTKPISKFYGNKARRDGLSTYCRPCMNQTNCSIRAADPDFHRNRTTWKRYRLSLDERAAILAWQNDACGICLIPVAFVGYCGGDAGGVDHCHKTGLNRGILCANCNKELGVLEKWGVEWCNETVAAYLIRAEENVLFLNPHPVFPFAMQLPEEPPCP